MASVTAQEGSLKTEEDLVGLADIVVGGKGSGHNASTNDGHFELGDGVIGISKEDELKSTLILPPAFDFSTFLASLLLLLSEEKQVLFNFVPPSLFHNIQFEMFHRSYEGMGLSPRNIHNLSENFRCASLSKYGNDNQQYRGNRDG